MWAIRSLRLRCARKVLNPFSLHFGEGCGHTISLSDNSIRHQLCDRLPIDVLCMGNGRELRVFVNKQVRSFAVVLVSTKSFLKCLLPHVFLCRWRGRERLLFQS